MSKHAHGRLLITRRDALKVCLVPAGAFGASWLVGCSEEAHGPGNLQAGAAAPPPAIASPSIGTAGSTPPIGASAGSSGGAAPQAGAQAGTPASAGSAGMDAPMSGGAGAAPSGGAGGMAGAMSGGAGAAAGSGGNSGVAGPGVPWASGGTTSMQGGYPDPFEAGLGGTACELYPSQTLGPCYASMPATREDISDGMTGLPVRLSFLVVRAGCMPIPNASVDIWHSGSEGVYSAYAMGTICNPGTENVLSENFGRGVMTTDDKGRVDFSTIFPGWYTGRSIHIHFTIRLNGREEVTSQLYFEDELTEEILAQGTYAARGTRDTTNATDRTFRSGGASPEQVLLSTAKRPDGVLHAWKVLSIG